MRLLAYLVLGSEFYGKATTKIHAPRSQLHKPANADGARTNMKGISKTSSFKTNRVFKTYSMRSFSCVEEVRAFGMAIGHSEEDWMAAKMVWMPPTFMLLR